MSFLSPNTEKKKSSGFQCVLNAYYFKNYKAKSSFKHAPSCSFYASRFHLGYSQSSPGHCTVVLSCLQDGSLSLLSSLRGLAFNHQTTTKPSPSSIPFLILYVLCCSYHCLIFHPTTLLRCNCKYYIYILNSCNVILITIYTVR